MENSDDGLTMTIPRGELYAITDIPDSCRAETEFRNGHYKLFGKHWVIDMDKSDREICILNLVEQE